jgi:putative endonuclease
MIDLFVIPVETGICLWGRGGMSVNYYVYILTNINNEVLYVGITSNLIQRTYQHKNKLIKGFSEKYNIHKLVHFEVYSDIADALIREKRIKKWNRS